MGVERLCTPSNGGSVSVLFSVEMNLHKNFWLSEIQKANHLPSVMPEAIGISHRGGDTVQERLTGKPEVSFLSKLI